MRELRGLDLAKPPGVAETIDWAMALNALGRKEIDAEVVQQTLGSVLKYREDIDAVQDETLSRLVEAARAAAPRGRPPWPPATRSWGTSSRSAACCTRQGSRSAPAGSPTRSARSTPSISTRQEDVYFSLRQTLVSRHDELDLFDRAFSAWFLRAPVLPPVRTRSAAESRRVSPRRRPTGCARATRRTTESRATPLELGASGQELLRDKDFAELTRRRAAAPSRAIAPDRALAAAAALAPADGRPARRPPRRPPHDPPLAARPAATPLDRPLRARKDVPRKLVVLCDVSGSMDSYARALLLFLHAVVGTGRGVEAFAFGTRLSRLTPDLATRDPDAALARCTEAVVDWGSGTRIGASLREFNEVYGRRALSRGAIVLIVSDGWEREDPELVGREMAKLARAAYAVVWVNPLKGNPQYQPLAGGMRAALPFVDRFLPGHNLRSLEELAAVLAGIERRHAA